MSAAVRLAIATGVVDPEPEADPHKPPSMLNLPPDFWMSRPWLELIRQAAHARIVSPDALLLAVLVRVAVQVPPAVTLPPIVGANASLDFCVGLIGPSGSGKSAAARVAADLVPIDPFANIHELPLGSGEGLIESYLGEVEVVDDDGKTRKERRQVRDAVLFLLDEGQALAEMGSNRKGATLLPTIRSAWSGATLGQANASADRRRHLGGGAYRFALLAGWQTVTAKALLDDAAGGTPQRFVLASAIDPTTPDTAPPWPGPLRWRPSAFTSGPLAVDDTVRAEILSRRRSVTRGTTTVDQLDSHADLLRLKTAALIAILDGTKAVTVDAWALAGQVLDTSRSVRAYVTATAQADAREQELRTDRRLVRRAGRTEEGDRERALPRVVKTLVHHALTHDDDKPCKRRCLQQSTNQRQLEYVTFKEALDEAIRSGQLKQIDKNEYIPGDEP